MRGQAKQALLEAARTALSEHGFAGTTARVIAATSGANLRSIAYHYGTVEELKLQALSTNFRTWLEPMIAGDLEAGLERFTRELPANAGLVAAWLEAVARPEHRARLRENQLGFISRMDVPQGRAHAIVTVCDGLMVRFLLHGEVPPVRQLVKSLR